MTPRAAQLQKPPIGTLLAMLAVCLILPTSTRCAHAQAAKVDPAKQAVASNPPEATPDENPPTNPPTEPAPTSTPPSPRAAADYGDFRALAGAQPERPSAAAPGTITDLIIIADVTASMRDRCRAGGEQRMAIAQWAMYDLLDAVPDDLPTSLVALHGAASEVQPLEPLTPDHKIALRRVIVRMRPEGNAELKSGFDEARSLLASRPQATPLVVLLTDGHDCQPADAAGAAAELKQQFGDRWHFIVVAISSQSQIQEQLSSLAKAGRGEFSWVTSAAELSPALAGARSLANAVRQQRAECLAKTERDLATSQRHLSACAEHAAALAGRLDISFHREGELRGLLTGRQADCDAARQEIDTFKQSLATAEAGIERFEAELTKARQELRKTETQVESLTADLDFEREVYVYAQRYWFWIACALIGILLFTSLFFAQRQLGLRRDARRSHEETAELRTRLLITEDQSRGHLERVNQLNGQLATAGVQLDDARRQQMADGQSASEQQRTIHQQADELRRVGAEHAAERSRAEGLQKQVDQLWHESVRLKSDLSAAQLARTAAEAQALGATREMAANKKEFVPPGPVIAPTVVPSTPSLAGAPSAPSAPSSSAAGGPSAPSAPSGSSAASGPSAPSAPSAPSGPSGSTASSGPSGASSSSSSGAPSAPSAPSSAASSATPNAASNAAAPNTPISTTPAATGSNSTGAIGNTPPATPGATAPGIGTVAGTVLGTALGGAPGGIAGGVLGGLIDAIFHH